MLTTREVIERRRSIRKYRSEPVKEEVLTELLEAARLAPSGCNAQPWRFKIVRDDETKRKLAQAAYDQPFIADALVVLVCCADIRGYLEGTVSGIEDLGRIGAIEGRVAEIILQKAETMKALPVGQIAPRIACNVVIAIEHIVIHILSGRGISGLGETEEEMAKGDTMFVPRGAVHWFYNPFDEPVEMIFVYTRPSLKSAGYRVVE